MLRSHCACETPVLHLQAEAGSVLLVGGISWHDPVYRSSGPCCRLVQSVTMVQTELHFVPAKKLFVSIGNQSNMLFPFLAIAFMHSSV